MICVLNAAQEAGIPFRAVCLKGVNNEEHIFGLNRSDLIEDCGKPDFRDDTKALLAGGDGPILSFVSGVQHVQIGLRRLYYPAEPPFDFVLPEAPHLPLDQGAEIIPFDAMWQVMRRWFSPRLKILRRLTRLAPGRVVQFVPPPPAPDSWVEALVRRHKGATPVGLPSRVLRWKLWRLTADVFRQHAGTFGARFVDCPPQAVDADGFMRDELVRNLTHGNQAFGALVLDQIRGLLR